MRFEQRSNVSEIRAAPVHVRAVVGDGQFVEAWVADRKTSQ